MARRFGPGFPPRVLAAVAAAAALMLAGGSLAAQQATPAATPAAVAGEPCTNLFGIAIGNACAIVVHASPDAGPIDVYVDDELALPGLTYGTLNDFAPVNAGDRRIRVVPAGAAVEDAVIDERVALTDGVAYEVAAVGLLESIDAAVLPIDTVPLAADAARIRVVHAAPDAPPVDVAVVAGDPVISDVAFGEASGYAEVPAGTYELEARIAGTNDIALPLPGTVLAPSTSYSVYVVGQVADASLGAVFVPVLISPDIAGTPTPVAAGTPEA